MSDPVLVIDGPPILLETKKDSKIANEETNRIARDKTEIRTFKNSTIKEDRPKKRTKRDI